MERTKNTRTESRLILETLSSEAFLTVNKQLLQAMGPEMAVYLSNLIDKYRYFRTEELLQHDGAFFLTHRDQQEQTGMSEYQLRRCKKRLVEQGILRVGMRGQPAKEFYWLDLSRLVDEFMQKLADHVGLDLSKTEPLDLSKTEPLNTLLPRTKIRRTKDLSQTSETSSPRAFETYLPLAEKLATIIRTNKNVKINQTKLNAWAREIRKLTTMDGIDIPRIERALEWYARNIGGQYVPVIESGMTLRNKFLNLEAAIQRAGGEVRSSPDGQKTNVAKVVKGYFRDSTLRSAFMSKCLRPAERLFDLDKTELAQGLINLHAQIRQQQEKHLSDTLRQLLPGPIELVTNYINWITQATWLTHPGKDMLDIRHKLFSRFRREEAEKDNLKRDPLTGQSYMRD